MHTVDIILKRRSVRKFKNKKVPWDDIVTMLNCGLHAPAAGNINNVKFIVIRDPANRQEIAEACHNQMWIAKAPCIFALVGEPEHLERFYGQRGRKLYTIQNCAAAAENMIIAAESVGLATCWVSAFDEDKIRAALGLPEFNNCHVIIPTGYADEQPKKPQKQWMKAAVFLEKWWAGRKWPAYGYYSQNVMKVTKGAGEQLGKAASQVTQKASEAMKKLHEKVIKRLPKE